MRSWLSNTNGSLNLLLRWLRWFPVWSRVELDNEETLWTTIQTGKGYRVSVAWRSLCCAFLWPFFSSSIPRLWYKWIFMDEGFCFDARGRKEGRRDQRPEQFSPLFLLLLFPSRDFLDGSTHLYVRVCASVRPSLTTFFRMYKNHGNWCKMMNITKGVAHCHSDVLDAPPPTSMITRNTAEPAYDIFLAIVE